MEIIPLPHPKPNAFGYTGPAARNPYFCTTGTAPDYTFVTGFYSWFQAVTVYNTTTGNVDHVIVPPVAASESGAQEALRIVQMWEAEAKIAWKRVEEGGIYYADNPTPEIELPDGRRLNAGSIVNSYYHAGAGVSAQSDADIVAQLGLPLLPNEVPPAEPEPETPPSAGGDPMPDMEGFLGAKTFFPGVFEIEPGDTTPVGTIRVAPNGISYERLATTWREVKV